MADNNKSNDGDNDFIEWAERPRYKRAAASNFVVNDKVYLKVGSTLTGPYRIAQVCRLKVYTLCDESGENVNNGLEVSEDSLQRA
ncbi:hypothetical protein K449DRAFT_427595 [Hypoxylon sp. EC38]|nr:hypothetical protein K449DRAFT_427595 [Hypoxylon sp. EC38]OTA85790.1 hypothetical protein M434DRAFT_400113 [Hypoxylon sp. CO27-5]